MSSALHRKAPRLAHRLAASLVTLALLTGLAVQKAAGHQPTVDAADYHAEVRRAAASIPYSIGAWVGIDVPPTAAAVSLLVPNVIIERRYERLDTHASATFLFVQCSDARDLGGHYPPVCYPAHGYAIERTEERRAEVGDATLQVRRYWFTRGEAMREGDLVVDNFLIFADGTTALDRAATDRVAQDSKLRYYGASQVQVVTTRSVPEHVREEAFRDLVGAFVPTLRALWSGAPR